MWTRAWRFANIYAYLGLDLLFPDEAALERHLRQIHAPFGPLTDTQWAHLARHSAHPAPGGLRLHYDPAIRVPFDQPAEDVDLWPLYDAIRCPTLVLRGEASTLLGADTAAAMTTRGPRARLVTFPGVGHAPALMAPDQIAAVRDFVLRYNTLWLVEKNGHLSPAAARQRWLDQNLPCAA